IRDYRLEGVAIASRYSHHITLNRSLNFGLRILDVLDDLLGLLLRNSLLNLGALTDGAAGSRLRFSITKGFQRHAAAHQFLLQNLVHIAQFGLVFGRKHQFFFLERYSRAAALEVKTLADFLHRLVERVRDFSAINLRDDIE